MTMANTIINALVNRKFTRNQNEDHLTECCICMETFTEHCDVTPLSHNENHYFHTKCLEEWLKRNTACPICRTPIVAEEELKFREELERRNSIRKDEVERRNS